MALACLSLLLGSVFSQVTPPKELILKGKVRDFVEQNPTKSPAHPHFYGEGAFQTGCSSQENNVTVAQLQIDTTNDIGDTALFKGDNRGPKLVSALDARVAGCYAPVDRFSDWYNDRATGDVNRPFLVDIKFKWNDTTNAYEYFDDAFFPIDNGKPFVKLGANAPYGHLLPAPNNIHNFGFTMEFHANFTYFKGKNQTFNFRGDDDVWAFINGKRVIDLGGLHNAQDAAFNLDSIAAATGLQDSLVYPLDFFFAERHTTTSKLRISTSLELVPQLSKPTVPKGQYFDGQITLTLSHSSPAAVIYYTTDGSTPTTSSLKYTGPITLSATTTLKIIATRPGYKNSEVVTETYTKMQTVATPKADPTGKIFTNPIQVTLTVSTPSAVIHYTVDGSVPDSTSPTYTAPLSISVTTTLNAKAYLKNWVASVVMSEVYTDASTLTPPVANPLGGGFVESQTVTLSVAGHPAASIRYTLDGTDPTVTSPLYAAPLKFSKTTTLKAKAFETDWKSSQVMTEKYTRLSNVISAVYTDFDGDGSIDGAVLHLDVPAAALPASVHLIDPVSNQALIYTSNYITKSAAGDVLTVRFPEKEFLPGTTFPSAIYGSFPSDVVGYPPGSFVVSDSVGPVPIKAVSHNKTTPEDNASVDITFSEPIDLAELQAGATWPFDIIRNGQKEVSKILVSAVDSVAGQPNTYRWTFMVESPVYPVFIDSVVLATGTVIHDAVGSLGVGGGKRIPVQGVPEAVLNKMIIQLTNPIVPQNVSSDPVITPQIRRDPFAAVAGTGSSEFCLSCPSGSENIFTHGPALPEWVIRSKYAFHYNFSIFDHLGNFISKTEGQITEAMMAKLTQDAEGFRTLRFRWIPLAHNGADVATGAYILKGMVINRESESQKGAQGENQILKQSQTAVFATFGYLRQR